MPEFHPTTTITLSATGDETAEAIAICTIQEAIFAKAAPGWVKSGILSQADSDRRWSGLKLIRELIMRIDRQLPDGITAQIERMKRACGE